MRSPQSAASGTFLRCHSNGIPSDLAFGVLVPDIREQPQSQLVFQPLDLAPELIAISGSGPVLPHTAQLRLQTTNFFHNQSIPCSESTSMISVTVQESCGSTRQVHSLCTARWLDIGPYVENAHAALPYKEIKLRKSTKQGCLRSFRRLFQRRAKCGKCGGKRVDVRLNWKEVRLPNRVKGWSRSLK